MMPCVCFQGTSLSNLLESVRAWCHIKLLDFLFYLRTAKSIVVSPPTPAPPKEIAQRCPSCCPIRLFRPGYFRGRMRWSSSPQCLPETSFCTETGKKGLKFARILTHLIEISCPIFSDLKSLTLFYHEQYFPKEQREGKCFQLLFVFGFFLSHQSIFLIKVHFFCGEDEVTAADSVCVRGIAGKQIPINVPQSSFFFMIGLIIFTAAPFALGF